MPQSFAVDPPDVLLASQFRRAATLPTRSHVLALAVLSQAVGDLRGCARARPTYLRRRAVEPWERRMVAEASAWFESDDASWPFGFVNICAVLHLDPDGVRRALAGHRAA